MLRPRSKEEIGYNYTSENNLDKRKIYKEFERLYPGENGSEKYLLILRFTYFFPYQLKNIKGKIYIYQKNGKVFSPKTKTKHLFPNKQYTSLASLVNRKVSNGGVFLLFSSYEELQEIEKIECYWKITYPTWLPKTNSYSTGTMIVKVSYPVTFEEKCGSHIFMLDSMEQLIKDMEETDKTTKENRRYFQPYKEDYRTIKHIDFLKIERADVQKNTPVFLEGTPDEFIELLSNTSKPEKGDETGDDEGTTSGSGTNPTDAYKLKQIKGRSFYEEIFFYFEDNEEYLYGNIDISKDKLNEELTFCMKDAFPGECFGPGTSKLDFETFCQFITLTDEMFLSYTF